VGMCGRGFVRLHDQRVLHELHVIVDPAWSGGNPRLPLVKGPQCGAPVTAAGVEVSSPRRENRSLTRRRNLVERGPGSGYPPRGVGPDEVALRVVEQTRLRETGRG